MELIFATKEENNKRREEAFIALTPVQRLELFLKMLNNFQVLPREKGLEHRNSSKGNFIITQNV